MTSFGAGIEVRLHNSFRRPGPTVEPSPRSKIEPRSTGGRSNRTDEVVLVRIELVMSTLVRSRWDAIGTPRSRCSERGCDLRQIGSIDLARRAP